MTGKDKFEEMGKKLKGDVQERTESEKKNMDIVKKDLDVRRTVNIRGLEDIPVSEVPLPFYLAIQPGTTGISLTDGSDILTHVGEIYKNDSGELVKELEFFLLRAKNTHKEYTNDKGERVQKTRKAVLGLDATTMQPFMMSLSVTSFGNFGKLIKQLKDKKVSSSWEYPITLRTEKQEETKMVDGKPTKVKYWTIIFELKDAKTDDETMGMLDNAYSEFCSKLDREEDVMTEVVRPIRTTETGVVLPANPDDIPF